MIIKTNNINGVRLAIEDTGNGYDITQAFHNRPFACDHRTTLKGANELYMSLVRFYNK